MSHRCLTGDSRSRLVVSLVAAALLVLLMGVPAAAVTPPDPLCRLTLSSERMPSVAVERGVAYKRDFFIDLRRCMFTAGPRTQIEPAAAMTTASGTTQKISEHFGSRPLGVDPTIFEQEQTWDCCGIETTYVDHQQTFSFDGVNSFVSQIGTTTFERTGTGWFITAGPFQQFNTPNPNSSVSTTGSASFNNTTFPCGCQPCDHTLYAEVRSSADGTWTHSSAFTGDPGQTICSGFIHVAETWGTR